MTPAAHLTRLRRRIALWLAVLMALSGSLASGLSHGALRTNPATPWPSEICTTLPAEAGAGNLSLAPADQRDQDTGTHTLRHCPLCLLGSHAFGPPPALALWRPLRLPPAVHALGSEPPQQPAAPVWRALARGPPARQRL